MSSDERVTRWASKIARFEPVKTIISGTLLKLKSTKEGKNHITQWNSYILDDAIDEVASHKAILQLRKRLRAVVVNNGGPIKHLFR